MQIEYHLRSYVPGGTLHMYIYATYVYYVRIHCLINCAELEQ